MKVKEAPGSEGHAARPGVLFAVAAVTVTAPRLALAFLAADGVAVPTAWRIDLLAVSSVATAVVLTGGTADLAHAIAGASPVGQGGGNPLSILPDRVQGVGSPTPTLSSIPLPHSCPWGCGRHFAT